MGNQSSSSNQSSAFSGIQTDNINLNTSPVQVGNQVRDGDQFLLIVQSRQGEPPKVWSSGDKQQTDQLLKTAFDHLAPTSMRQTESATT